jgi:serine/threonine protein kinase/Tol biopolymer transport system component
VALLPGARFGPYEIVASLGAGGMGEVYRARDARLKRDVALKLLPASYASDPDRLARFQREAEVLGSLNHPHIAHLYGVEDARDQPGAPQALIMELVEGEDLSQRLARGAIPIDEALSIARQVADALEAAHEQGIIHRDLKPANIKLRSDGTVKVLDFGLAKLAPTQATAPASDALATSPTITSPALMTGVGTILGTAAYMSPEQARGKMADRRSDIWAFGCVLFELVTGLRAFTGDEVTDLIVAVVSREPDWSALPADLPEPIARLIKRCLTKDVRARLPHMGAARLEIEEVLRAPLTPSGPRSSSSMTTAERPARSGWLRWAIPLGALLVGTAIGTVATRGTPARVAEPPAVTRLMLAPASAHALTVSGNDRDVAISRNGRRIVYVGDNGTALFVQDLDKREPVRIDVGGLPHNPTLSPDGQWISFLDGLSALRRVPVSGGRVQTIGRSAIPGVEHAWGDDNMIVVARYGALWRVPAEGGEPQEFLTPNKEAGEQQLATPWFMPGARALLYTIGYIGAGAPASSPFAGARTAIVALDVATKTTKLLVRDGTSPRYLTSGHLIFQEITTAAGNELQQARGPTLRVVPFDRDRLEITGAPAVINEPIFVPSFGRIADFDVSDTGTLVYVPATTNASARRLAWVDREGREDAVDLPVRTYAYPTISPSGTEVAIDIRDQENDAWVWDTRRNTLRRLTFGPSFDQYAVWSPDGKRIVSIVGPILRWQPSDGTGKAEMLAMRGGVLAPYGFSPDGNRLVFREDRQETGHDLMLLTLNPRGVTPLIETRANELNATISPDGRWVAYQSDESGVPEVYVRPFPDVNGGRWQVSPSGGRTPQWRRDGRELFYVASDNAVMAVSIDSGPAFASGTPQRLFRGNYFLGGANSIGRTYDVSPDGRRFLMIKPDAGSSPAIAVVQHWFEELNRLTRK